MYRNMLQTSVAAAALFAFGAAYSAPASAADDTFKTGSKASLTMSGQVNRAVLFADDGTDSAVFHVDNDASSTRIRWVGKGKVTDTFSAGMLIEMQIESNSSSDTSVNIGNHEKTACTTCNFGERKMEAWLAHKNLGKLTLGQGDPATNGTAEITLSGMSPAMYAGIADTAGGQIFRSSLQPPTSQPAAGPAIAEMWGNQHDGRSRTDRIRYDTPKFAGFMFSASHEQGDLWDVALRHSGKFGQFKTSAAIAYVAWEQINSAAGGTKRDIDIPGVGSFSGINKLVGTKSDQFNGSISILHDSGLNVTFSAGTRDNDGQDQISGTVPVSRNSDDHYYVMLGYIAKLTDVGTTRFGVDYGQANDIFANDSEITTFGIGVNQNLKDIGTDIYASFRNHDAELKLGGLTVDFDDVNTFMVGARVRF